MVYKDYLNAARKHKYTCEVLVEKIDNLNEDQEATFQKYLLLNLYYLSGYIIECIVKYGIYSLIGYDRKKDVAQLNQDGLVYKEHIKHHRFKIYTEHLNKRISGKIPLINDERNIDKPMLQLYRKWDAEVRYSYDLEKNNKHHYLQFYQYAGKIFDIVKDNVKG